MILWTKDKKWLEVRKDTGDTSTTDSYDLAVERQWCVGDESPCWFDWLAGGSCDLAGEMKCHQYRASYMDDSWWTFYFNVTDLISISVKFASCFIYIQTCLYCNINVAAGEIQLIHYVEKPIEVTKRCYNVIFKRCHIGNTAQTSLKGQIFLTFRGVLKADAITTVNDFCFCSASGSCNKEKEMIRKAYQINIL